MNVKSIMALAVVFATAACAPNVQVLSIVEAAGPAADEALAAAKGTTIIAVGTTPQPDSK